MNINKLITLSSVLMFLAGCGSNTQQEPDAYESAAKSNKEAVNQIIADDKLPTISRSLERENLKRRINFINQPDRIGYLYLLSDTGQLIKEVQVKGKVSSLNSYLTPMEEIKIVPHDGEGYYVETPVAVQSSDIDGTWGENDNGIFWFTADDVYQEWTGMYLYSSERLSFEAQPVLVEVSDE